MRAVIHAGFHKTGTTSTQAFFQHYAAQFAAEGYALHRGRHNNANHVELHACAMRDDRTSPFKTSVTIDDAYRAKVAHEIAAFNAANAGKTLLFSAEGVSLLRYEDELRRLAALLPDRALSFIFCRREREAWRTSYRAQHAHLLSENPPPDHFGYLADDSWLLDFEARLNAFRDVFGANAVTVIDYDEALAREGNVIPAILRTLGVESAFAEADYSAFRIDPRPKP